MASSEKCGRDRSITDGEFLGLLVRLRERHLDPEPVDNRRFSFYSYEMGDSHGGDSEHESKPIPEKPK